MVRMKVTVDCKSGLHLRPATAMCTEAQKYESTVRMLYEGKSANAKSVLSVLACGVGDGGVVEFTAEGPDEEKALKSVVRVLLASLKTGQGSGGTLPPA